MISVAVSIEPIFHKSCGATRRATGAHAMTSCLIGQALYRIKQKLSYPLLHHRFWWSRNSGIHLSAEPTQYQLVAGINNKDQVLINILTQGNELNSAFIIDVHQPDRIRYVEFPKNEIHNLVDTTWKKIFKFRSAIAHIINTVKIRKSIVAKAIDDSSIVSGEASISITFKYKIENR